jgi:hypothetical protein
MLQRAVNNAASSGTTAKNENGPNYDVRAIKTA